MKKFVTFMHRLAQMRRYRLAQIKPFYLCSSCGFFLSIAGEESVPICAIDKSVM